MRKIIAVLTGLLPLQVHTPGTAQLVNPPAELTYLPDCGYVCVYPRLTSSHEHLAPTRPHIRHLPQPKSREYKTAIEQQCWRPWLSSSTRHPRPGCGGSNRV